VRLALHVDRVPRAGREREVDRVDRRVVVDDRDDAARRVAERDVLPVVARRDGHRRAVRAHQRRQRAVQQLSHRRRNQRRAISASSAARSARSRAP
jgi:Skp family chaperone for outer membrane proteins